MSRPGSRILMWRSSTTSCRSRCNSNQQNRSIAGSSSSSSGGGGGGISAQPIAWRRGSSRQLFDNMTGSRDGNKKQHLRGGANQAQENKILTMSNVFENLVKMEYAVRGPLLIRAIELEKELQKGAQKPFKTVIKANIGDAHAMGQKPISFIRQVLALTVQPQLLNDPSFPEDAKQRASAILDACKGGSVGSYTDSPGIELIRRHCAKYIELRDGGVPADYRNIAISNGASDGIKNVLKLFKGKIDGKAAGCLIPIPQYPLYSASLCEFGIEQCGYYLDEENKWSLDMNDLERAYNECSCKAVPRLIVVINPGNPTGQVLTRKAIEDVIKFAYEKRLFVIADEVYQHNIYDPDSCFHSMKKVAYEMGEPYRSMEMASFMSVSKGYMGECGLRGGYCELLNIDEGVMATFMKSISAMLCSTVCGQVVMDVVVNPPTCGEPSYEQYEQEKEATLSSLAERSRLIVDRLNSIPGYKVQPPMGAMYVFPRVDLPEKVIQLAKEKNMTPDTFYAFELLENTGICIIPGSGFGQLPNTYHFRTTILPQKELIESMLSMIKDFHIKFLKKYSK